MKKKLTNKQKQFVMEYIKDFNASRAYMDAGFSVKDRNSAAVLAHKLVNTPEVKAAIDEQIEARNVRSMITADNVLKRYWDIATADISEFFEVTRACCRYCYGNGNGYQWIDEKEYEIYDIKYGGNEIKKAIVLAEFGGYGYDPRKKPNDDCPRCFGKGIEQISYKDLDKVSEEAKKAFNGIKENRNGRVMMFKDQLEALGVVAKHIGMLKDKIEVSGEDGKNINIVFSDKLTDIVDS